jgi:predicted transcriptional regulator
MTRSSLFIFVSISYFVIIKRVNVYYKKEGNIMLLDSNIAENKLLLLYVLDKMKLSLSSIQITQIVLENTTINYFTLQQYIDELTKNELITKNLSQGKAYFNITKRGKETLDLFISRLPENWSKDIDNYISKNRNSILDESHNIGSYRKKGDGEFEVQLKILENESELINLSLGVATHQQAEDIINNWKTNGEKIYASIIKSLIDNY